MGAEIWNLKRVGKYSISEFLGNIGSIKMINTQKIFVKNRDFWGDIPRKFSTGETHPPVRPVATPMALLILHLYRFRRQSRPRVSLGGFSVEDDFVSLQNFMRQTFLTKVPK